MADSPLKRERYVGTGLVPVRRGFRGRIPLKYVQVWEFQSNTSDSNG